MLKKIVAVTLVLVGVLAALSAQYLLLDKSINTPIPLAIKPAPSGELGVLLDSELLMLNAAGQVTHSVDLADLGFQPYGDMEFFSNGDLLLYHRADRQGLRESLQRFLRQRQTEHTPQRSDHGLYRCALATGSCHLFSGDLPAFSGAFHLTIDASDRVYISDTARFFLYQLDANGRRLATSEGDWKFPNALAWHNESLYLANTNRHRIEKIDTHSENFGQSLEQIIAIAPDTETDTIEPQTVSWDTDQLPQHRHRWPFELAYFDNRWWVLVADNAMKNARLLTFDSNWQNSQVYPRSGLGDPVDLAVFADQLIAIDWQDGQLKQLTPERSAFSPWGEPRLRDQLTANHNQRQHYRQLSHVATGVLVLILVIGIAAAWLLEKDERAARRKATAQPSDREVEIPQGNEPVWLENSLAQKATLYNLGFIAMLALWVFAILLMARLDGELPPIFFVVMIGSIPVLLGSWAIMRDLARSRIGVQGEHLLIAQGDKTASTREGPLYYNGRMINIGGLIVPVGNAQLPMYRPEDFERWVTPHLNRAHPLSQRRILRLYWDQRHPYVFVTAYLATFMAFCYFSIQSG